jgi:hypothetical protein
MKINPKSIAGGLALVLALAIYVYWNHTSLEKKGRSQIEQYLETELPARAIRDQGANEEMANQLDRIKQFEIIKIESDVILSSKASVRAYVNTHKGEEAFYFYFEKILGSWKLRHQEYKKYSRSPYYF